MTNNPNSTVAQSEREIVITRVFNAPRKLVYEVWTDPKHIPHWFGPKGFTARVTESDLRPGGAWRYVMIDSDGKEYPSKGVFQELVPFERIVTSDEFDEGFEEVVNMDLPQGLVVTILFEDVEGSKTKVTIQIVHATAEDRRKHEEMGVIGGWNSTLDCFEEYLATV